MGTARGPANLPVVRMVRVAHHPGPRDRRKALPKHGLEGTGLRDRPGTCRPQHVVRPPGIPADEVSTGPSWPGNRSAGRFPRSGLPLPCAALPPVVRVEPVHGTRLHGRTYASLSAQQKARASEEAPRPAIETARGVGHNIATTRDRFKNDLDELPAVLAPGLALIRILTQCATTARYTPTFRLSKAQYDARMSQSDRRASLDASLCFALTTVTPPQPERKLSSLATGRSRRQSTGSQDD